MQFSRNRLYRALAVSAAFAFTAPAMAELSPEEVAKLGTELTPVGANPNANDDGTIPAWTGGLTSPPEGWDPKQGYIDPFPQDDVKFTITGDNLDQYRDKLSAGQIALLEKYDNFRMPVYETRRTAALPQRVYDTIKAESPDVKLEGFGIKNLDGANVPFPIPENGLEAIWNHNVRYLGGGVERQYHWFPVQGDGDFYKVGFLEKRIFDENMDRQSENRLLNYTAKYTSPPTLEGTVQLVHEPIDQVEEVRSAWIYNVGQRRVRRAPDLAYDNANDGTEGIRITDQFDAYNGAPDRYNWKLVGKKEIYVPYNAYKLSDKSLNYEKDILRTNTINSDLMRYELHRVWVVEATLREDSSHIYGKRTFYLDEDSWNVLMEDAYDTRGDLWRVAIHPVIQFYDVLVPWYRANIYHDLNNGSYLVSNLANEIDEPWEFGAKGRYIEFQPDALRRSGR
ncbi:DUF1329 domain-containing protein [Marinobacter panjinensis]|uniref:DUF1329 domain-containing protein n=1 Tax=Marinobacter panjinensis TaxID=2576384 RepID=A0A4V6CUH9_9GAMM|nr:DUF1329 domain-containing protein [Marinobacter panjinensis]TKV69395.1 DUF1329 domain-containing protein [Marinobacter panjinensis]